MLRLDFVTPAVKPNMFKPSTSMVSPVGFKLIFLLVLVCVHTGHQHPVQTANQTCTTDNESIIIEASPKANQNGQTATMQFNERRRDMFFEDYSIKQIEVVDTSVISNNSLSSGSKNNSSNANKNRGPGQIQVNSSVEAPLIPVSSQKIPNEAINSPPINSIYSNSILQPQRINILTPKLESSGKPSCVKGPDDTFCEVVENYPKSAIKNEINFTIEQFSEIFGPKEIDGRTIMDVDHDESVCRKVPRVIYPQMAKNQANQWIYVVNEVEYTQAVVAEICERPGKPCSYMDNLPMGMYSSCKQKYSYKRLLALHPTEKRTYSDAFRFPSCCSCYIKTVDDFLGRSGFRKIDSKVPVVDTSSRDLRSMANSSVSLVPSTISPVQTPTTPLPGA